MVFFHKKGEKKGPGFSLLFAFLSHLFKKQVITKTQPDVGCVVRCRSHSTEGGKNCTAYQGEAGSARVSFFSGKAIAAHYDARFDAWGLLVAISLPDLLTGTNVTGFCPGLSTGLGLTISVQEAAASTTARQTSAEERCADWKQMAFCFVFLSCY